MTDERAHGAREDRYGVLEAGTVIYGFWVEMDEGESEGDCDGRDYTVSGCTDR